MTGATYTGGGPASESSRIGRLSDAVNPILVKEVRQALRGRYFRISFWVTLLGATMLGLTTLLVMRVDGSDDSMGVVFFGVLFAFMTLATQVLVPFSAFLSVGAEWDENTWDLLTLSNLRPRQIVLGKVLSAGVQALLYYSAFAPFLVFAFLLRGVDVSAIGVAIALSLVASLLLSSFAAALSSLSGSRFARVLLMVFLASVLVQSAFGMGAFVIQLVNFPTTLRDPEFIDAVLAALTIGLALAAFFFAGATARLAHPEENGSTALRLTTLGVVAVGLGWVTYMFLGSGLEEPALASVCVAFAVLGATGLLFVTERERLGRRTEFTLPRSRLFAWLATPLLPGGARGLLFFVVSGALVAGWMHAFEALDDRLSLSPGERLTPWVLLGYGLLHLGLVSGLFSAWSESLQVRILSRVMTVVVFLFSLLLPALFGFLFDIDGWDEFEHPLNLFLVLDDLWSGAHVGGPYVAVLVFGGILTLAVNAPRLWRMLRETARVAARVAARS